MYRHINKYEIKYTDVDAYDILKPSALLGYLQESACLSADELGFGFDDVMPHGFGFILSNWYYELFRPLRQGEVVEVQTWPLKVKHLIFLRDFEIYVGGEKVGVATSRWCMVDIKTFKIVPVNSFFKEGFFDNFRTDRSVDFNAWKIPASEGETYYSRRVGYSDYDHYFHVNNTKYADYLLDAFSAAELKDKFFKSLQVTYVKQCKEGEVLNFIKTFDEGYYIVEGKVNGEQRVQFKVKIDEI